MSETFNALVAEQADGKVRTVFRELTVESLPDGDVTVAVAYSTVNYKDGLAVTGKGKVIRAFPMVCGIDFSGTVERSSHPDFAAGEEVVCTGWGMGETHWGGYAGKARVSGDWLIKLPSGMTLKQAMAIGTAGFTSMLSVMALEHMGVWPGAHEVLISGAAGGVGSIATALLADLGYRVAASTGRAETHDYLRSLGAATILERVELATPSGRPLDSERWAGAVDSVGGETLASLLRATRVGGSVAACGLAGGADLPTTVLPFILRGVSLIGINSVFCDVALRRTAWDRLGRDLARDKLASMTSVAPFAEIPTLAEAILKGQVRGRVVIDVNA